MSSIKMPYDIFEIFMSKKKKKAVFLSVKFIVWKIKILGLLI